MNKKLLILAQRRERLVSEAAKQRVQLAQAIDVWRGPLALADQGLAAISFIKKHIAAANANTITKAKMWVGFKWLIKHHIKIKMPIKPSS